MRYDISHHYPFYFEHAKRRMERKSLRDQIRWDRGDAVTCIKITLSEDIQAPYGQTFDWSQIINWFDEVGFLIFTWSSFTGEWQRAFVLNRPFNDCDRIEFALRFE